MNYNMAYNVQTFVFKIKIKDIGSYHRDCETSQDGSRGAEYHPEPGTMVQFCTYKFFRLKIFSIFHICVREAAKKVLFLVARSLRPLALPLLGLVAIGTIGLVAHPLSPPAPRS